LLLLYCSFVSGAELDNVKLSLMLPLTLYITQNKHEIRKIQKHHQQMIGDGQL
jgi:hypothetical protein